MSNSASAGEGMSQEQGDVEQGKKLTKEDRLKLYKAALNGDWDTAQAIYNPDRNKANANITNRGETALHIAALAEQTLFVKKLVNLMSKEGLLHKTEGRNTAFSYAVVTGNVNLAEAMMEEKKDLEIPLVCQGGESLLHMAAVLGHREMVGLLYRYNKDGLKDEDRKDLLVPLIDADMFDIALDMLENHPIVAATGLEVSESSEDAQDNPMDGTNTTVVEYIKNVKRTTTVTQTSETTKEYNERVEGTKTLKGAKATENKKSEKTPLLALARKSYNARQSWFKQSQIHFFCFICSLKSTRKLGCYGVEHEHNLTDDEKARKILQCIWKQITLQDIEGSLDDFHFKPIFLAAEQGNVGFLTILVNDYPDVLLKKDEKGRTVFHVAVLNRQENIFKLIHKFGAVKKLITMYIDSDENNMLHLAGKLAPSGRLCVVPGAALQLQREIMWFEEVKKVIKPWFAEAKNKDGITPGDLFEKEHEELMKEGEKWMTGTANSCTLVGTLIATVVFAAAFTVPGGNGQDTGIPIFLKEASFKVFVIFDAISLILSISSVVTFLSILTSRFRLHDFHKSLPRKLFIGLSFLLFSMVAMLAAFIAAFFVIFKHGRLLFVSIPLAVLSLVPVLLFVAYHFSLFWDLLKSIYRSLPKRILCFHWG